jgi:hypothetical protein
VLTRIESANEDKEIVFLDTVAESDRTLFDTIKQAAERLCYSDEWKSKCGLIKPYQNMSMTKLSWPDSLRDEWNR